MDTFVEPTPAEVQNAVLQFMGQNIGELKQLDNFLVAKNQTLQGLTLQPKAVLDSVAQVVGNPQPPAQAPPVPQLQPSIAAPQPQTAVEEISKDQLEFNFNNSSLSKRIFDELKYLREKFLILNDLQESIVRLEQKVDSLSSDTLKKKD